MGIGTMIFEADILLVLFEAAGEFAEVIEVDEADDEGFFDKPAVSPSESGTSTPPPLSSDPENTETFLSRPALTT